MKHIAILALFIFSSVHSQLEIHSPISANTEPLPKNIYYNTDTQLKNFPPNRPCHSIVGHAIINYFTEKSHQAYDKGGHSSALSSFIFGADAFPLASIYLPSKLSVDRLITLDGAPYGNNPDDQYIGCLAPTTIIPHASKRKDILSLYYSFVLDHHTKNGNEIFIEFGIGVPIEHSDQQLTFTYINGSILKGNDYTIPENNLFQFFNNYISFEDFFITEVLASKGIEYIERQTKTGVGNVFINLMADYTFTRDYFRNSYSGISLALPTSKKNTGTILWENILGNGGTTSLEIFGNCEFITKNRYVNPILYLNYMYIFGYKTKMRVPALKNSSQVTLPPDFEAHTIENFCLPDTCLLEFADSAYCVNIKGRNAIEISFGNRFYFLHTAPISFALYFIYNKIQSITLKNSKQTALFQENVISSFSNRNSKKIYWELEYFHNEKTFLTVGASYCIGGKNTQKLKSLNINLNLLF